MGQRNNHGLCVSETNFPLIISHHASYQMFYPASISPLSIRDRGKGVFLRIAAIPSKVKLQRDNEKVAQEACLVGIRGNRLCVLLILVSVLIASLPEGH